MNILPLICAFLIVFGICAHSFFWQYKASWGSFWVYEGRMRAEHVARSLLARKEFYKVPVEKRKVGARPVKRSSGVYESRREKYPPSRLGRISLSFMFAKQTPDYVEQLSEVVLYAIKALYHDLFASYSTTRAFEKDLVAQWIELAKEHPDDKSFFTLFPKDAELADVYYKMLKGSSGKYPALESFFTLEDRAYPIYFHFAPTCVLEALFGKGVAKKILAQEETKWKKSARHRHYTLTKPELDALFLAQGIRTEYPLQMVDYACRRDHFDKVLIKDVQTGVEVYKTVARK